MPPYGLKVDLQHFKKIDNFYQQLVKYPVVIGSEKLVRGNVLNFEFFFYIFYNFTKTKFPGGYIKHQQLIFRSISIIDFLNFFYKNWFLCYLIFNFN